MVTQRPRGEPRTALGGRRSECVVGDIEAAGVRGALKLHARITVGRLVGRTIGISVDRGEG